MHIRNPWGGTEWKGKWSDNDKESWTDAIKKQVNYVNADDGSFHISLTDFIKFYSSTTICYINPDYSAVSNI